MSAVGLKRCTRCDEVKPVERFAHDAATVDRLNNRCRDCRSVEVAASRYGFASPDAYVMWRASKNGTCESCGDVEATDSPAFHVDHDHSCCAPSTKRSCGRCVRGLLCPRCNRALGVLENADLVTSLARYLGTRTVDRRDRGRESDRWGADELWALSDRF